MMTVDVLLREGSSPFGTQDASHQHMLSFADYLQSLLFPDTAAPFQSFMDTALVCCSD